MAITTIILIITNVLIMQLSILTVESHKLHAFNINILVVVGRMDKEWGKGLPQGEYIFVGVVIGIRRYTSSCAQFMREFFRGNC